MCHQPSSPYIVQIQYHNANSSKYTSFSNHFSTKGKQQTKKFRTIHNSLKFVIAFSPGYDNINPNAHGFG